MFVSQVCTVYWGKTKVIDVQDKEKAVSEPVESRNSCLWRVIEISMLWR
jgi:hypothetical protein